MLFFFRYSSETFTRSSERSYFCMTRSDYSSIYKICKNFVYSFQYFLVFDDFSNKEIVMSTFFNDSFPWNTVYFLNGKSILFILVTVCPSIQLLLFFFGLDIFSLFKKSILLIVFLHLFFYHVQLCVQNQGHHHEVLLGYQQT